MLLNDFTTQKKVKRTSQNVNVFSLQSPNVNDCFKNKHNAIFGVFLQKQFKEKSGNTLFRQDVNFHYLQYYERKKVQNCVKIKNEHFTLHA